MNIQQHSPDGVWTTSEPIQPTRLLRLENWLRCHGRHRLANALARWDERGLGR